MQTYDRNISWHTHFSSCHPSGVSKGFIKGEALRLLWTNSSETTFDENIRQFKSCLRVRGYPNTLVNKVLSEVKFEERKSALQQKEKTHKSILPFVTQYLPAVPNLKKYLDEQMAFNTESAFAERNIQRASHYLLQKKKIAQSLTRSIQTLKAKNTHSRTTGVMQACHSFFNFQNFLTPVESALSRKRLRGSQELVFMPVVAPCL